MAYIINYFSANQRLEVDDQLLSKIQINHLESQPETGFYLTHIKDELTLCLVQSSLALSVDFTSVDIQNRVKRTSAKLSLIKAVEGKQKQPLAILDMTAGLGQDSFCLAARGHSLTAIEQNPYVFLLLQDGLNRANKTELTREISRRIRLYFANSAALEQQLLSRHYDVIYLDPMFPERRKTAKVKKNMQLLHQLVGVDGDNNVEVLSQAQKTKSKKIVIKRHKTSDFLGGQKPSSQLLGKSSRFDIYVG